MASRLRPLLRLARTASPLRPTYMSIPKPLPSQSLTAVRYGHSIPRPPPPFSKAAAPDQEPADPEPTDPESADAVDSSALQDGTPGPKKFVRQPRPKPNQYQLVFTCTPCGERSSHNVSKQGYHHGSVLVSCPGCMNRHVISDHLGIFGDRKFTIDQLLKETGGIVKRGNLSPGGDIEFYPDELAKEEAERGAGDVTGKE